MDILKILDFLTVNPILVTLIATIIGGDGVLLSLAFLAGSGFMPLWIVFTFSIIGFFISDSVWYFIGHKSKSLKISKRVHKIVDRYNKLNHFTLFLFSKVIYGTRILTVFYLSKKLSYKRFVLYAILLNILLVSVLVSIGYYAGKGFTKFQHLFESIGFWFSFFFVMIILILISKYLFKWLAEKIIK